MRHAGKVVFLIFILLYMAAPAWSATPQPPGQPRKQTRGMENVLVGRISIVEGELLRYVPEQKDWVVTVKDSPFGLEDALYSGENAKAEFLMPNSTWIRIGPNTQIQMVALKPDATEVDVASGMARFIDRSSKAMVKATTPFGYAVAEPGAAFDLYVGDESVEVIAIRGKVDFIHDVDGARYDVIAGSMSILADNRQATGGDGKVDADWDEWNSTRDTVLAQALETKGESVQYLPEGIREDSGTLDENGRWEQVYYQGESRRVWRPTNVGADWAPYTVGRWTDWGGDYTWVPEEPFGYVTGHYGYWFSANDYWYWAPPVVSVGIGSPYWGIGFSWYPGRVGWLYSDVSIGWFPLLPWEPFYANRWWGPWGFAVHNASIININVNRYAFANRAAFVNRTSFTTVNNLSTVRQSVNGTNVASQFRGAPVARTALGTAATSSSRFRFTNADPSVRPSQGVTSRVAQNSTRFSQATAGVSAGGIRQQVATARTSAPGSGQVAAPRISGANQTGAGGQARALNQNPKAVSPSSVNSVMSAGRRGGGGAAPGTASVQSRGAQAAQRGGAGNAGTVSTRSGSTQSGQRQATRGTASGSARSTAGLTGQRGGTAGGSGRVSTQSGRRQAVQGNASGPARSSAGLTGQNRATASGRSSQVQGRARQAPGGQVGSSRGAPQQSGGSRGTPRVSQGRAPMPAGRNGAPAVQGRPGGGAPRGAARGGSASLGRSGGGSGGGHASMGRSGGGAPQRGGSASAGHSGGGHAGGGPAGNAHGGGRRG